MAKRDELKERYEQQIGKRMFNAFTNADTSKTTKYLQYFCSMWEERKNTKATFTSNNLILTVEGFEQLIHFVDEKDLYNKKYLDFNILRETVENAYQSKLDSEFKREDHVRILYEDSKYLFLEPITHIGSSKYGAGTKWCTTMRNEGSTFKRYVNNGFLAYLVTKGNKQKNNNYCKIAFYTEEGNNPLGGEIQIYNEMDNTCVDLQLTSQGWEYEDLTKFTFLFRMEALKKFQYKRAKYNVESTIKQIQSLNLDTLKKDVGIISGKTLPNDDTFTRLDSVMKTMIEKIQNY